jgi:hypothetical protein
MSVIFPLQVFAQAPQYNLDEQAAYTQELIGFANIYKEPHFVQKASDELKKYYKTPQDQIYLQKYISQVGEINNLVVKSKDNTIEISADGIEKIVISDFKTSSVKINGKNFVNQNLSLEEAHKKIIQMLTENKNSLFDFILPSANASGYIMVAVVIVGILVLLPLLAMAQHLAVTGTTERLNEALTACEQRDEKIPYKKSTAAILERKLHPVSTGNTIIFPEVSETTDCMTWGRIVSKQFSEKDTKLEITKAASWCPIIKKLNTCTEDYKAGITKKNALPIKSQTNSVK